MEIVTKRGTQNGAVWVLQVSKLPRNRCSLLLARGNPFEPLKEKI